jgi:hypothetical protein
VIRYAKFYVAVVGAVAAWAATYFPNDPTVQKWVGLAVAVATALSVYAVPNQPPKGKARRPDMSEQGHADVLTLAVVALVVVLILVLLNVV